MEPRTAKRGNAEGKYLDVYVQRRGRADVRLIGEPVGADVYSWIVQKGNGETALLKDTLTQPMTFDELRATIDPLFDRPMIKGFRTKFIGSIPFISSIPEKSVGGRRR